MTYLDPGYEKALELLSDPATAQDGIAMMRAAAESDDTRAMCDYGLLFITPGGPVTQNSAEALKWFTQAAGHTDDRGQFLLGKMYYDGDGVQKDYVQASKWFTLSAEKGYAIAQYYLGHMYLHGNGVPMDVGEAVRWFALSVDRQCNEARIAMGDVLMTKALGTEDPLRAYDLYNDAMRDGYPPAFYRVGMMYYNGTGTPQNMIQASKVFRKGIDMEEYGCYFMLGKMYYLGQGVQKDTIYGKRYMEIAEENGFEEATAYLDSIDRSRKEKRKWSGGGSHLIEVEVLKTPDLLSAEREPDLPVSAPQPVKKKRFGIFKR